MKFLIKILLFVLGALTVNLKVASASISFPNIQEATTSYSCCRESSEIDLKAIENDLVNCCQNGQDLVDYRNWGAGVEANAAKGGTQLWPAASGGRIVINGIEYTTHALERMQLVGTIIKGAISYSRGIPPSVVENAIKFGKVTPGNTAAEVVRTFENVRVITNIEGTKVISVIKLGH